MKIATYGIDYLGVAYSTWLSQHHHVIGIDENISNKKATIETTLEIAERESINSGKLFYTNELSKVSGIELI